VNARGRLLSAALVLAFATAAGAAEGDAPDDVDAPAARQSDGQRADPWEPFNRKVFQFNDDLDEAIVKPVAKAYKALLPGFARTGVTNFFNNFADGWSAVNHLLQGKVASGMEMGRRFTWNSTFGVFGLIDMASEMGLERQSEDFGQTLGRWGFASGPFLVLPIFGASTVRDAIALPLDRSMTPGALVHGGSNRLAIFSLELTNTRADFLAATRLLDEIAFDRYSFVRDAYLARRRNLVYDGDPPELPEAPASAPAK